MNNENNQIPAEAGPSTSTTIKRTRQSKKAKLIFPVSRVDHLLREEGSRKNRYNRSSAVFLAAVLEYFTTELIQSAGWKAQKRKSKTITPMDQMDGLAEDDSLRGLFEAYGQLSIEDGTWIPTLPETEPNADNPDTQITMTPTRFMASHPHE